MATQQLKASNVRVGVRVRPLGSKEIQQGGKIAVSVQEPAIKIGQKQFTFDAVFNTNTDQDELFSSVSASLLDSFVDGYNATQNILSQQILAYGQTGSGKTYTMGSESHTQPEGSMQVGLIPRFIAGFFERMQKKKELSDLEGSNPDGSMLLDYSMEASFLEVYGEDVFDLLKSHRSSLPLREDAAGGVVIAGLATRPITNPTEALHVLHEGTNNRTTAATLMNLTSSRSHAVFTVTLTQVSRGGSDDAPSPDVVSTSKFTFVDLAGSERMKKTGAEGERAREGIKINEGLLALGNVINALADEERLLQDKKVHVPYRQSKLTRLLQDALGGNSQTLFLACVSPSDTNVSETLSTLHYANRARNIRNAPIRNLDATSQELQRLQALTRVLQSELVKARFQEKTSNDDNVIGQVDEALLKRPDVEEYLTRVFKQVDEITETTGSHRLPLLPVSSSITNAVKMEQRTNSAIEAQCQVSSWTPETPGRILPERFNESFIVDVNPDEDMAILDHLIELQQQDHDYDSTKKQDDEQLLSVDGQLEKEEKLLLQLRDSLKAYHSLKSKYEELMAEVQSLETERNNLASQLEKATTDPSIGCSAVIKKQLEHVEQNLSRARRETLTHREKYRAVEEQARRSRVLERKIADLKQAKSALVKKQKDAAAKYKEVSEAKTKELIALRRKEKSAENLMSQMKTEIKHHKSNLEKRKQFIAKLSDKLKQTESHLIRLLSMRRRDLNEKASHVGRNSDNVGPSEHSSAPSLSSDDIKSMQFILDKMVETRIEDVHTKNRYAERVSAYSQMMQNVVTSVEAMKACQVQGLPEKDSQRRLSELRENIAADELKLELIGGELKELEVALPDKDEREREEKAVKKLMASLPTAAVRKLLLDSFSRIVSVEAETKDLRDSLLRKDAALLSFESEVESLQSKIAVLQKDLAARCILMESGENVLEVLQSTRAENEELITRLEQSDSLASSIKEEARHLGEQVQRQANEILNLEDKLALAKASLNKVNMSMEAEQVVDSLHQMWDALGIDSEKREQAQHDIQHALSNTCARLLHETTALKSSVESRVAYMTKTRDHILQVLNVPSKDDDPAGGLLQREKVLHQQLSTLEKPYEYAAARRHRIFSDVQNLSATLQLAKSDLPQDLQALYSPAPSKSNSSGGSTQHVSLLDERFEGNFSPGGLDGAFLLRCEKEVDALRVQKSELLVKNRQIAAQISKQIKDMHLDHTTLLSLVESMLDSEEEGVPSWWGQDPARDFVKLVTSTPPSVEGSTVDNRYFDVFAAKMAKIAASRGGLTTLLREIVEEAQEALLDIVGREVDVSEAYASFHNALVRLPLLSEEFAKACISEMEALVVGVETMTQSEIETLTVVWEALNITAEDRRDFWGDLDREVEQLPGNASNPFYKLRSSPPNEEWIVDCGKRGEKVNAQLRMKLRKLRTIHEEVERLRSKQDTKSQILTLDSEVRILNLKLLDFEEMKCNKQRLVSKKAGGTALLKEERFRKQMKTKFVAQLSQLASLLQQWKQREGMPFDASLLSEDVRMLLDEPDNMQGWIEKRTKLMPSRTVLATPLKVSADKDVGNEKTCKVNNQSKKHMISRKETGVTPPRKRIAPSRVVRNKRPVAEKSAVRKHVAPAPGVLRSANGKKPAAELTTKRKRDPQTISNKENEGEKGNLLKKAPRRKESSALLPFGRVLSELASPQKQGKTK
eukprot:Nitzschia sp. Nitz4//scaffold4_size323378//238111//243273//NITZ4_000694-RA/size323378-processed-gene-0.302-mRNA-1//1//CDS//3329553501//2422//frame0